MEPTSCPREQFTDILNGAPHIQAKISDSSLSISGEYAGGGELGVRLRLDDLAAEAWHEGPSGHELRIGVGQNRAWLTFETVKRNDDHTGEFHSETLDLSDVLERGDEVDVLVQDAVDSYERDIGCRMKNPGPPRAKDSAVF